MILEIGLLAATYFGARVVERHRRRAAKRQASGAAEKSPEYPAPRSPEQIEKSLLRNRKLGVATVALFGLARLVPPLQLVGLAAYCYTAIPYMRDVANALGRDRKINVSVLFFFGDVLTLGTGQYFTAAVGLWIMHVGSHSVYRARNDSKKLLRSGFEQLPQTVWVLMDGAEVGIPLEQVQPDDVMIIRAGEVVAVDGHIVSGIASIDQHALTGESQPVEKEVGDPVLANTVIVAGEIQVRVERAGSETTANRIVELLQSATDYRTTVQLKAEEWADRATVPTLAASVVALPTLGVTSAVVLINSHIGNRIRMLAPMATLQHVSEACQRGILVKDGRVLERLAEIDTMVFDKTGTLTTGEPRVQRVIVLGQSTEREVVTSAAIAERRLPHPIARAILAHAELLNIEAPLVPDTEYRIGYGITVRHEGRLLRVGSSRFLGSEGITVPATLLKEQQRRAGEGHSMVLVSIDQDVIGAIELRAHLRPEIPRTLEVLRKRGIHRLIIVSGDHEHPTRALAEALDIDEYHHGILPEDKARIVEQLQSEGRKVCFVGDGINDAIAMKKANLSVSMAGATAIATDVAEVLFMDGSLARLADLYEISDNLDKTLHKTLKLTIAPGVVNIAGALVFHYSILTSLAVNLGFCTLAALSAQRPVPRTYDADSAADAAATDADHAIASDDLSPTKRSAPQQALLPSP